MAPREPLRATSWEAVIEHLDGAYAPATVRAYRGDFVDFARWCGNKRARPFPADAPVVLRYVQQMPRSLKPTTIRRRLAAISRLHTLVGAPDPTTTIDVALELLRRYRKHATAPRQALGLTRERLADLLETCDTSLSGLRDRAMILVGFEALCRRSELVQLSVDDLVDTARGRIRLAVHQAKAGPVVRRRFVWLSGASSEALRRWTSSAEIEFGPLFRPVYGASVISRYMTPLTVSRVLKARAKRAGFSHKELEFVSGHSLRVGAAQQLALNGHDIAQIMRAGGWRSVATLARYIEGAPLDLWE